MKRLKIIFLVLVILVLGLLYYIKQPAWVNKSEHRTLVSSQALKQHVYALSVTHAPRDFRHSDNLKKAALYIKNEFSKTNAKVTLQNIPNAIGHYKKIISRYSSNRSEINLKNIDSFKDHFVNVIAEFGPDTQQRIIIGAHYDAVSGSPGADDNATGVAGLIEIAKLLSKTKLKIRIELVAYSLEEPPFYASNAMGSYAHAKATKDAGSDVKLMISLEMLGYFSDKVASQSYPIGLMKYIYTDKANFISVVGKFGQANITRQVKKLVSSNTSIPVYSINAPTSLVGIDFSDHRSYWKYGYPAVMITNTAFYRNRHYHQHSDTYEKLDYERMSSVVAAIFLAVKKLANTH